eukprot:1963178-Pyramimonas_sp.AAC.1
MAGAAALAGDTMPGGYWIYQGGHAKAKDDIQTAGLSQEELRCVKASMGDSGAASPSRRCVARRRCD